MDKDIIGICIGSANTVIGTYNKGVFEVVLSEQSSRTIPTIVSYEDRERKYGEIKRKNNKRTIIYPNRWLGIQNNFSFVNKEKEYSILVPTINNNLLSFKINFKNKIDFYTPECLMALFFNKIKKIWEKKNINPKEIVVSIPDYSIAHERKAMLEAIKISGLKCTSLLNESSAIILAYGMHYLKELNDIPRLVTFVDLGHSQTTIIYAEFTKSLFKILSISSERFCGAREFDYLIAHNVTNGFLQKYGNDPMTSPKAKVSLIEKINKSRKALTGNKEMSLHIDSLLDGQDLDYNLKREEFEKIIEPTLKKFETICKDSLAKAKNKGVNIDNIHSVEMVGDTLRTPILSSMINQIFNRQLSKTLVPDEFIARGCSFFSLINSPNKHINFSFFHYNPYLIQINNPCNNQEKIYVFLEGENLPSTKSFIFRKSQIPFQSFPIELFYDEKNPNLNFLPNKSLYIYNITLPLEKQGDYEINLTFVLDLNCIPRLDKVTIIEKNENEKLETPIKFDLLSCSFGTPDNKLNEYINRERKQNKEDMIFEEMINYKNGLENYLYDIKNKLNDTILKENYSDNEKNQLNGKIDELNKWLSEDKDDLYDKKKLMEKGKEIKKICNKIYQKYNELTGEQKIFHLYDIIESDELDNNALKEDNNNINQINEQEKEEDNNNINEQLNQSDGNLNEIEMNNNVPIDNNNINSNIKVINHLGNNLNSRVGEDHYRNDINNNINNENINDYDIKNNNNINNINNNIHAKNRNNNMNMNNRGFNMNMNNRGFNMNMNNRGFNMNMNNINYNLSNANNNKNDNINNINYNMNNINKSINNNMIINNKDYNNNNMNINNINNNIHMNNNMNSNNACNSMNANNNINNQINPNKNGISPKSFPMNSGVNNGMMNMNNDDFIKYLQNNYKDQYTNLGFINLIFISSNAELGINVLINQNDTITNAINKYINESGDSNPNLYIFNGISLDETSTISQSGLKNNSIIKVRPLTDFD